MPRVQSEAPPEECKVVQNNEAVQSSQTQTTPAELLAKQDEEIHSESPRSSLGIGQETLTNDSSLSSTLSSSLRSSLDYEDEMHAQEADEEDENEAESVLPDTSNTPLLHVQSFLQACGERDCLRTQPTASTPAVIVGDASASNFLSWRNNLKNTYFSSTTTTTATHTTTTTTTMPTATIKPTMFTISTKFLRKSRSKLKAPHLLNAATPSEQHQAQVEMQQQELLDDANAKFKSFSIDSLLNM